MPALAVDRDRKAPRQPRGERRDGALAGLDARLDFVTVQVQHERLVGAPAQLDALALGRAQHTLRRRHAALCDVKLERVSGGLRAFPARYDRQRKARAERDDSRDKRGVTHGTT